MVIPYTIYTLLPSYEIHKIQFYCPINNIGQLLNMDGLICFVCEEFMCINEKLLMDSIQHRATKINWEIICKMKEYC